MNLKIRDTSILDEFVEWMTKSHINDMLNTKCFTEAHFYKQQDHLSQFSVDYLYVSTQDFERYTAQFSEKLRADFVDHFGDSISVDRTHLILEALF